MHVRISKPKLQILNHEIAKLPAPLDRAPTMAPVRPPKKIPKTAPIIETSPAFDNSLLM